MTSCGVALVLLLDVSGSIDAAAWAMQRDGHAAAFRAPSVVRPIVRDGLAAALIQWDSAPRVALGWRVLRTEADAERMAQDIEAMARTGGGSTYTSLAITAALTLLESAPCGDVPTIDLVTDGPGDGPVSDARTAAAEAGVRINGLGVRGIVGADPVEWLREHVVTDGGFVMEANGWGEFAAAVRRKLSTEVGALP